MTENEITTVAADYMYLVVLGSPDIMRSIAAEMDKASLKKDGRKRYISTDIDDQIDYLPETEELQNILLEEARLRLDIKENDKMSEEVTDDSQDNSQNNSQENSQDDTQDDLSDITKDDNTYDQDDDDGDDDDDDDDNGNALRSDMKYYVMAEGMETAQCHTCGEGYVNVHMLIEIDQTDQNFKITYPVLNLDDEVNPEDLIGEWVETSGISHLIDSINIRLVYMVGTQHDILVFAAYVSKCQTTFLPAPDE